MGKALTFEDVAKLFAELGDPVPRQMYHVSKSVPHIDSDGRDCYFRYAAETLSGFPVDVWLVHPSLHTKEVKQLLQDNGVQLMADWFGIYPRGFKAKITTPLDLIGYGRGTR